MNTAKTTTLKTGATALLLAPVLSFTTLLVTTGSASAQGRVLEDEFHSSTGPARQVGKKAPEENPVAKQGSLAMMSADSPALQWFERFDDMVTAKSKTPGEVTILKQPFNQELERVQRWTKTASSVAKRYRLLAKELRTLAIPPKHPGLTDYRNLTADWYDDSASIYEDLIRPRRAAKTMEELDEGLNQIKERAIALNETNKSLRELDIQLRKAYNVHMRKHDDPLQQYVRGRTN